MRTSVILNLKGGVAKTATAVNVAAILASDYKQRVLLVDADSQCNTTEFFGCDPGYGNLAEVLRQKSGGATFAVSSIMHTNFPGIDLLAGDDSLMDLDLTKVETEDVRATVLREMVSILEEHDAYADACGPKMPHNLMGFMVTVQPEIRECVRPFLTQIFQGTPFSMHLEAQDE